MDQKQIEVIAGQTGMHVNAVPNFMKKFIEKAKKNNPGKTEEEHIKIATDELLSRFKNVGMTQGKPVSGIIFGVTAPTDTARRIREDALEAYVKDPAQAVKDGLVMEEYNTELSKNIAVPLDNRATWKTGTQNQGFGKPLQQNFLKNVFGLMMPEGLDIKVGNMTLNNEKAFSVVPLNQPCDWKGIDKTLDGADEYAINQSSATMFVPRVGAKMDAPKMIEKYAKKYIVDIDNLESYVDQNPNSYQPVITRCTIMNNTPIMEQEGKSNSSKAVMKVQDIMGEKDTTITAWVQNIADIDCNYAPGQEIYLVGQVKRVEIKDKDKQPTGETEIQFGRVMGICPIGDVFRLEGNAPSEATMPKMPVQTPSVTPSAVPSTTPAASNAPAVAPGPVQTPSTMAPPKEEVKSATPPVSDGMDFS